MRSRVKRVLVAAGITLAICVATAVPAAAATSGSESVRGVIVASGGVGDPHGDHQRGRGQGGVPGGG